MEDGIFPLKSDYFQGSRAVAVIDFDLTPNLLKC